MSFLHPKADCNKLAQLNSSFALLPQVNAMQQAQVTKTGLTNTSSTHLWEDHAHNWWKVGEARIRKKFYQRKRANHRQHRMADQNSNAKTSLDHGPR